MFWTIIAFIAFPLLGHQFFGGIGIIFGLLAAILYVVIMKYSPVWSKRMDERTEQIEKNVADGKPATNFISRMEASTARIKADTERRKQKQLEKKLEKKRSTT